MVALPQYNFATVAQLDSSSDFLSRRSQVQVLSVVLT